MDLATSGNGPVKARVIRVFEQGFWDRRGWGDTSFEVWVSGYHSWHVWLDGQEVGSFAKWRAAFDSAFDHVTSKRVDRLTLQLGLPFNHLGTT